MWLAGILCARVFAAGAECANLAAQLEPVRRQYDLPALGAAVVRDGELIALGVTGVRKYGGDVAVTPGDCFHLGSCTKAVTATLIGRLVEEGTLRWDTSMPEVFPELVAEMQPGYQRVTVDHLLAHRGGLPGESWPKGETFLSLHRLPGTPREQREAYVRMMLRQPPEAELGAKYLYANAGYAILGAIAERVTDTAWEQLIIDRVCAPLGMTSAGFGAMGSPGLVDQPWQHKVVQGRRELVAPGPLSDNPAVIAPGGCMHCSLADWAKFAALHAGGPASGVSLLRPETLEHLHTPFFGGDYAGGWVVCRRDWAGGAALTHAGTNTMNYAVAWLSQERHFAVLAAANQDDDVGLSAKACDEAAWMLIQEFLLKTP